MTAVRGRHDPQVSMLAFVDLETRVPPDHPLRTINRLANQALAQLSPEFDRMYAQVGRPSIPPEQPYAQGAIPGRKELGRTDGQAGVI